MSYYHLSQKRATLYTRGMIVVRKVRMLLFFGIIFFVISGCQQQSDMSGLYEKAFGTLLSDDRHIDEMDYISLFIQSDDVTRADSSAIESHIREKYQKDTYSYTQSEIQGAGAYGKEDLNEEGIYLYIKDVENKDGHTIIQSEKYYTVGKLDPVGVTMTFTQEDGDWVLDEMIVEWEGAPK